MKERDRRKYKLPTLQSKKRKQHKKAYRCLKGSFFFFLNVYFTAIKAITSTKWTSSLKGICYQRWSSR